MKPSPAHLSRAQVRAFDRHAIDHLGIPACVLMENAGRGAAQILHTLSATGPVVLCCGKGNNGGDGLVIARHLTNRGVDVRILLFARPDDLSPDAALQWNIVQKMNLSRQVWPTQDVDEPGLDAAFSDADWIVDALLGTGLTGAVRAPYPQIIEAINRSRRRALALDIPSGLDCDTGEPLGSTVRAEHTVTFVAHKLGFRNPASKEFTGHVHVVDIGITPEALA